MPFELDLNTREIYPITQVPNGYEWLSVTFKIRRLVNDQHDIEWEDSEPKGKYNLKRRLVVVPDRVSAFDIEYYTRGEGRLMFVCN
jgi:hypothetical protein